MDELLQRVFHVEASFAWEHLSVEAVTSNWELRPSRTLDGLLIVEMSEMVRARVLDPGHPTCKTIGLPPREVCSGTSDPNFFTPGARGGVVIKSGKRPERLGDSVSWEFDPMESDEELGGDDSRRLGKVGSAKQAPGGRGWTWIRTEV